MALLGWIIRIAIRNLHVQDITLYAINAACLAAYAAFFVDGFFSFSLRINSILRVFWVINGIVVAIHYLDRRTRAAVEAQ